MGPPFVNPAPVRIAAPRLNGVLPGRAGQEVFAGSASEAAQTEGGEAAGLLELAKDRLDDGLPAGVASASVRLPELEAHRAGGPTVLGLKHPVLLAGPEAVGAQRADRAVR